MWMKFIWKQIRWFVFPTFDTKVTCQTFLLLGYFSIERNGLLFGNLTYQGKSSGGHCCGYHPGTPLWLEDGVISSKWVAVTCFKARHLDCNLVPVTTFRAAVLIGVYSGVTLSIYIHYPYGRLPHMVKSSHRVDTAVDTQFKFISTGKLLTFISQLGNLSRYGGKRSCTHILGLSARIWIAFGELGFLGSVLTTPGTDIKLTCQWDFMRIVPAG